MATLSASSAAASSAAAGSAQALRRAGGTPVARIRWDRLGRAAMLCLLIALAYLYISAGVHIYSTWRQSRADNVQLAVLEREHTQLAQQHEALARRGTVEEEARRLGMARPGEQPYVIPNLPRN